MEDEVKHQIAEMLKCIAKAKKILDDIKPEKYYFEQYMAIDKADDMLQNIEVQIHAVKDSFKWEIPKD